MADARDYTVHLIGHGHIDPVWRWRWTEGYEEVRATFLSALQRMNETPAFRFTASSACFYAWVRETDPDLFEEIRERVKEGRWEIAGGMWIEPDCNVPSGESFVRQGLYGQRFFQAAFGRRAEVGFNPDSFGHAGTLPQILSKLGMNRYLFMRPMPLLEMQYPEGTTFWWMANDGSRVLTSNIPESYNGSREEVMERLPRLTKWPFLIRGQRHLLCFFGVGNHGGGPTKRAIAALRKAMDDPASPSLQFSTLGAFFDGIEASHDESSIPTIDTDLQHHARGCYSVHSEIKRLNRRAEQELMTAERFASAGWLLQGRPYPQEKLEAAWKDLLFNQFHDILAGTSIEEAYEDARDQMGRARFTAREIANVNVQSLAGDIDTEGEGNPIVVFNPLPWPVRQCVTANPYATRHLKEPEFSAYELADAVHLVDEGGRVVGCQPALGPHVGSTSHTFVAEVPAFGYRCYHMRPQTKKAKVRQTLKAELHALENDWWRIEIDPYDGHISRLFDKRAKTEVLKKGLVLAAMADQSDTWSHQMDEWRVETGRFGGARISLLEEGEVRASLRITTTYGRSQADTVLTIYRDLEAIDCRVRVNWQEGYTMLKCAFETHIAEGMATYDTAYGSQVRDTEGFEEPGQMWFDLTGKAGGKAYGVAVINDGKYSFDVRENVMRLTALRSPLYCHHDRTRVDASQPYALMDQGWQSFGLRLAPHAGRWEDAGIVRSAWEFNAPAFCHLESRHPGPMAKSGSFLDCDAENVALTVAKRSEDDDALIVRGYETAGRPASASIGLPALGRSFPVSFAPHEIKTLRIDRASWTCSEVNLLEE